jgi:sterol desaturase/sphingolipid hydroxylase (fatty acid hydroxylase superfamily)
LEQHGEIEVENDVVCVFCERIVVVSPKRSNGPYATTQKKMRFIIEVASYILGYDLWFYVSHVLLHHPAMYKRIHHVHHSVNPKTMCYEDTYVAHWIEGPLQCLGVVPPLLYFGCNGSFLAAVVLLQLRGLARHDPRATWWIGNHHLLHHKHPRYNFGEYWLDSMFGTQHPNEEEYEYGLIYI